MFNNPAHETLEKIFNRLDVKLMLTLLYIAYIGYFFVKNEVRAAIVAHVTTVLIISIFRFGINFVRLLFFPIWFLWIPIEQLISNRYIRQFNNNIPAEAVIILGHSDWLTLKSWIKPNYFDSELKSLVAYLTKKRQGFSFYTRASVDDVKAIMRNPDIKEVYFFGHGDSHVFCLGTSERLYYCDFKCEGYRKKYVHQVHCGTKDGTPLMKYVVPKEHWQECFFFPKEINGDQIIKEFKKRTKMLDQIQR